MSTGGGMDLSSKNYDADRVITLTPRAGKDTLSSTGLVDPRLFNGTNVMYASMGPSGLWSIRYKHGLPPEELRQQFTSFTNLMKHLKIYFGKRNIDVKED